MNGSALAALALVPMITGPLPHEDSTLTVRTCTGDEVTIPLGKDGDAPDRDCHQKACHAGNCRQKYKRGNLI